MKKEPVVIRSVDHVVRPLRGDAKAYDEVVVPFVERMIMEFPHHDQDTADAAAIHCHVEANRVPRQPTDF